MYRCESTPDCHIQFSKLGTLRCCLQPEEFSYSSAYRGCCLLICTQTPWSVELALRSTLKVTHKSHGQNGNQANSRLPLWCASSLPCPALRWEKETWGVRHGRTGGWGGGGAASGSTFQSPSQLLSFLPPISELAV